MNVNERQVQAVTAAVKEILIFTQYGIKVVKTSQSQNSGENFPRLSFRLVSDFLLGMTKHQMGKNKKNPTVKSQRL